MSNVYLDDSLLTSIGNSIRGKNGASDKYTPAQMATAIDNLSTATLGTKDITANGTYNASDDSLDGYSSVNVNVASSGGWDYPYLLQHRVAEKTSGSGTQTLSTNILTMEDNSMIMMAVMGDTQTNTAFSVPSGWTQMDTASVYSSGSTYCYYIKLFTYNTKVSAGTNINPTVSIILGSTNTPVKLVLVEIGNCTTITPLTGIDYSYSSSSTYRTIGISYSDSTSETIAKYKGFMNFKQLYRASGTVDLWTVYGPLMAVHNSSTINIPLEWLRTGSGMGFGSGPTYTASKRSVTPKTVTAATAGSNYCSHLQEVILGIA